MMDWSYIGFAGSIIALGLLGLVGVTLLPLRTFQLLRMYTRSWRSSVPSRAALVLVAVAAVSVALYGLPHLARVLACLTDMRCGANRAGGMISLAFFGAGYLAFEFVAVVAKFVARRRGVAA
jgi:hypothetical protein